MMTNDFLHFGNIKHGYKPDILTCLANLSNDEVFTPPNLVNDILDILPKELFASKDTKFLDPVCKSGVFLREIAKRLMQGLENVIVDEEERRTHIFTKQLFGIAITELTAQMSRRSLYCSKDASGKYSVVKFNNKSGNISFKTTLHTFKKGNCIYCGASEREYGEKTRNNLESHAYEFIHMSDNQIREMTDMKFDVIIGNPPYQLSDGGSGNGISAKPIYNKFVEQAKKLNPRFLTMIIPSRWFAGGKGLDEFRESMLSDKSIRFLIDYPKSRDCFEGVDIAGGVCYFLWDRDTKGNCKYANVIGATKTEKERNLNEFNIFIRDNIGLEIVRKIKGSQYSPVEIFARNTFGFVSSERGGKDRSYGDIKLFSSQGTGFVTESQVLKNSNIIQKYKVSIGKLNPDRAGVNNSADGMMNVITKVRILLPNEIVTESYLVLGAYNTMEEAKKSACYFRTKFVRYMISLTLSSMNISRENFQFVPIQDFNESWTDEKLYKKYNLSKDEIEFIESMIRPMDSKSKEISQGDNNE